MIEIYQRAPNLIRRVARGEGTRGVLPCWLIIVVDGCFSSGGPATRRGGGGETMENRRGSVKGENLIVEGLRTVLLRLIYRSECNDNNNNNRDVILVTNVQRIVIATNIREF